MRHITIVTKKDGNKNFWSPYTYMTQFGPKRSFGGIGGFSRPLRALLRVEGFNGSLTPLFVPGSIVISSGDSGALLGPLILLI